MADDDWLAKEFRDEASSADVRATGTSGGHEQVRAVYEQAREAWARAHLRVLHAVLLPSGPPPRRPAATLGLLDKGGRPVQAGERVTLDGTPALRLTVLVPWAGGPRRRTPPRAGPRPRRLPPLPPTTGTRTGPSS